MGERDFNPQHRRAKRRRNELIMKCIIAFLVLIIICLAIVLIKEAVVPQFTAEDSALKRAVAQVQQSIFGKNRDEDDVAITETGTEGAGEQGSTEIATETDSASVSTVQPDEASVISEAERHAAMYDYESAIACLQASELYATSQAMQTAATGYEATRAACAAWTPDQVTHIFFHTIIWDASKAFDGDQDAEGYNQYMVTMDEFSAIMHSMYEKGYVMVSMHDMCTVNEDGTVTQKSIYLPSGKIPFVLSQDDVSYYHYMDGDGFAQKLILDENGDVKCTYLEGDGTVSVGDYDMVPWIDTFVDEHPDFSYHGHKGTIALTGYEGILGYRTDEVYRTQEAERLTSWQKAFLEANPDYDWQADVDSAAAVAEAMKADGWEFASHTWGHINPLAKGIENVKTDTQRWLNNVGTIVGDTDIIIFAFGADISDWEPYDDTNEYFTYLKENGFSIYCCVDSTRYWVQMGSNFMRMGRRNIDGYRMYYNPDLLSDLFDVSAVWDALRPDTVAQIG